MAEYKECFSLYDKQQRRKIKATDLLMVMQCLGASPRLGRCSGTLQTPRIGEWARLGQLPRKEVWVRWVGPEPYSSFPGTQAGRQVGCDQLRGLRGPC